MRAFLSMALLTVAAPLLAQTAVERLAEANRLRSEGKTGEALVQLRAAAETEPGNGRVRYALGSILNAQGYYPEALRHAEAAVTAEPANGRFRYGYGVVLAEHGRFAEAVENFDQALTAHPDMTYGWLERGAAKLSLGDGAGAAADWRRARESAPRLIWTVWYPATGDFLAGRFAMAADAFKRVSKAEPGFAPAPVWAYVADRRAGAHATVPKPASDDWPTPVLDHFTGKLGPEALLSLAAKEMKSGDERRIGEAHFFIAQKALLEGNRDLAAGHLRMAIAADAPRHLWKLAAERDLETLSR